MKSAESTYDDYHRRYYQSHKAEIVAYNKELREWRIAHHLCRECGKRDAFTMNGRTRCADCVERDTARRREKRGYRPAWERVAKPKPFVNFPRGDNGICWQCNKLPAIDGKRLCPSCYEKKVEVAVKNLEHSRGVAHPWNR